MPNSDTDARRHPFPGSSTSLCDRPSRSTPGMARLTRIGPSTFPSYISPACSLFSTPIPSNVRFIFIFLFDNLTLETFVDIYHHLSFIKVTFATPSAPYFFFQTIFCRSSIPSYFLSASGRRITEQHPATMVDADFNTLFSVLASSKRVFWAENAQLTEDQRQQLWNQRFGQLATQLCASSNPPQQQSDQQVLASRKRAMERTLSVSIPPAKRPALVGPRPSSGLTRCLTLYLGS